DRGRVAGGNQHVRGGRVQRRVRDAQADADVAGARVRPLRRHSGGVVELAVAVEVPRVGEGLAARIRGIAGVEGARRWGQPRVRIEREGRDRRAPQRAVLAGDDLVGVLIGELRLGNRAWAGRVQVLADVEVGGVEAALADRALIARPAEVLPCGARGVGDEVD